MKLSTYITKYLENNGVKYIFGISAGTCSSLWDSLNDTTIKPIITKNEAGAVYSATNYANISNDLSVSILAGGVGINNAINGIADAYRRKLPVLILSGYVHRWQIGKGAIQELDTSDIVKPITKYSKTLLDENTVLEELKTAMEIALTPPYGPVHLSIPIDLQMLDGNFEFPDIINRNNLLELASNSYDSNLINEASEIINNVNNGIIFVGRGCKNIGNEIMELSTLLNWKIVVTPEGKGIIPSDFKNNLGVYGFSGTDAAADYVENSNAECVLFLGTSLGESATRNYNEILIKNRKVIHIDWDENELNKVFRTDLSIQYSLEKAIPLLLTFCNKKQTNTVNSSNKTTTLNKPYIHNHTGLSTRLFLEKIPEIMPDNYHITCDIGEFMNFVFKYLPVPTNSNFDISLNYGAMGTAIGGAIGTALATPSNKTAVIVGDGSFFMNGNEILTAKEYELPIVYFVINNSMLGYVEHGHKYLFNRKLKGLVQNRISIKDLGNSIGIKSLEITSIEELENCKEIISMTNGPLILELITDGSEKPVVADRFKALNNES